MTVVVIIVNDTVFLIEKSESCALACYVTICSQEERVCL